MSQETVFDVIEGIGRALSSSDVRVLTNPADTIPMGGSAVVAMILWTSVDYDETFQGAQDKHQVTLRLFCGRTSDRSAHARLHELISRGPTGVKALIEEDEELNASWYVRVVSAGGMSIRTLGEAEYLSVDFTLEVQC